MKNILLPTDFSENSWNAIAYALQLFKNENCTFYLLNVYTPVIYSYDYDLAHSAEFELLDVLRHNSEDGLNKFKQRMEKEFTNDKHTISEISSFNSLVGEIEELNRANLMDFIVMGTKGATGAKEILFGTNTVHVFNKVKCPVLAIPENFQFETPKDILFPSDYNIEFNDKQVKPILDIANQYNSRINVLHVLYDEGLTKAQKQHKQQLEDYLKQTSHLFHTETYQDIPGAIEQFQSKVRVNLLMMVNNKRSFFENLFFKNRVKQMGFHLNLPFLVIPSYNA